MEERWIDIPEYKGTYQISNLGNVKSLNRTTSDGRVVKGVILKPFKTKIGYLIISLCKNKKVNKKLIHRLVLEVFINKSNLEVNHINSNPSDNRLENLEYVNRHENISHKKLRENKNRYIGASFDKRKNKWLSKVTVNKKQIHLGYFNKEIDAAKAYIDALDEYGIENKYASSFYENNKRT